MVLTIPVILDDYYEEIEQSLFATSNKQILNDCDYIIGELAIGEWYNDYSKQEVAALVRFRNAVRSNLKTACVIDRK